MAKVNEDLAEFVHLFNEARYSESHEALQGHWRENPSNSFYKALIQLAGAYMHWENESFYWAESMFRTAARLLRPYAPTHQGLNVEELVRTLELSADVAKQRRADRSGTYRLPRLRLELGGAEPA